MCTVHAVYGKTLRDAILADFSTIYALRPVDGVSKSVVRHVAKIIAGEKMDISA